MEGASIVGNCNNADAVVTIYGKEYALFKIGPLSKYPYMVDISTGRIPQGKQRSLLKAYLMQSGANIELREDRGPHWYVRQAISVAQNKGPTSVVPQDFSALPAKSITRTKKTYLPLTVENIEQISSNVVETSEYRSNFALIHDVITRFPQNSDRELVAMKVSLIDSTNSTHLSTHIDKISLSELVELILHIQDFDKRLAQGDPELASQLAQSNGKINLFSFATKYCTYHNVEVYGRDDYSIFDSVVKNALPHYCPNLTVANINLWRTTYDYATFNNCIQEILDQNKIHIPFRRRKFDYFLWYANRKNKLL